MAKPPNDDFSAAISPLWALIIAWQIDKPKPEAPVARFLEGSTRYNRLNKNGI